MSDLVRWFRKRNAFHYHHHVHSSVNAEVLYMMQMFVECVISEQKCAVLTEQQLQEVWAGDWLAKYQVAQIQSSEHGFWN